MFDGTSASAVARLVVLGALPVLVALGPLTAFAPPAGLASPTAAQTVNLVTISQVTVSPEDPIPGELVTVTATVQNSARSETGFEITAVELSGGGIERQVLDLGTLGPGDTMQVSLTATFEEPGIKDLLFYVYGSSAVGTSGSTIRQPVTVVVEETEPRIDTEFGDLLAQAENDVIVEVVNGKRSPVRDVRVTLSGEGVAVEEATRSAALLPGAGSHSFNFTVTSPVVGYATIDVDLSYTATGVEHRVSETREVYFKPLGEDVASLSAVVQTPERVAPGGSFELAFSVANRGESNLRDLTFDLDLAGTPIRAGGSGTSIYVDELPGESSRTVRFDLKAGESADSGIVTLPLTYRFVTADGVPVTASTTMSVEVLGEPELSAFVRATTATDEGVEVTLDVANVGSGVARSAAIRADGSSYYLGDVRPGDFETATLTLPAAGEYDVVLTYRNGFNEPDETEQSVTVPTGRETGTFASSPWLVGVVALLFVGVGVWGWRRWTRGRDESGESGGSADG